MTSASAFLKNLWAELSRETKIEFAIRVEAKQTFIQNRKQSWRCDNSTDMRSGEADNDCVNLIIRQKHSGILQEIAGKMLLYWI